MVMNKKIEIVGILLILFIGIGFVSAISVSTPYMENKELKLFPGEIKDLTFVLQNSAATENINVRVNVLEGSEILTLTDETNIYEIIPGDKVPVNMEIKIPEEFEIGEKYHIKMEFATQTEEQSGTFGFGVGIQQNFDVIIGEEIKEKLEINPGLMVLIIIILIILFRVLLKKKKGKK